ncbi:flagellar biosynthetic protein FliR [Spirochaeta cellobiosiphila]|uniref:flagellar biosynthetic protein FliR n=1 Tax=Spirochaeta cellobiosiphila TaxID=504483 RepID=UPI00248034B7|nr:flagellar biosynthetic protein FliR [Spirochaeta cellobiosiphila]
MGSAPLFFIIFARVFAFLQTAPLTSSSSLPAMARVGLGGFTVVAILPMVRELNYVIPDQGLGFALLLLGEILTGILLGFIIVLVYSSFQMAGQFFSVQMGFGASQVFDPLAQIEIPLLGQLMNMMAMFVFISIDGFQRLFLYGIYSTFRVFKASDLLIQTTTLSDILIKGLSGLFSKGLILSIPILGTLLLVTITTGLMAKAAPQMNLLMIGFPISITIGFVMMILTMPYLIDGFSAVVDEGFYIIEQLISGIGSVST